MAGVKVEIKRTGNVSVVNRTVNQFALGRNEWQSKYKYTDAGGGSTLNDRLLVGVTTAGAILPLDPTAVDGSQYPYGFLNLGLDEELVVADGAVTAELNCCIKGRVDLSTMVLKAGVALTDVIGGQTLEALLQTRGFWLVESTENTKFFEE